MPGMSDYGYAVEVDEGYDEAVVRARLALKAEGFSIITEMHVGGSWGPMQARSVNTSSWELGLPPWSRRRSTRAFTRRCTCPAMS